MSMPKRSESPLTPMSLEELKAMREAQLSRRRLLQRSGSVAVVAASGAVITSVDPVTSVAEQDESTSAPYEYEFIGVPESPEEPPAQEFVAFSEEQAAIVDALTARILPGSPEDPGAREAGVIYYIDHLLSRNSGIHEATYTAGPYARTYEGDTPSGEDDDDTIWVKTSEISRYGYQAPLSPLQVYEIALPLVQEHARQQYGAAVQELGEDDQDQIVWDLLDQKVGGFEQFSSMAFFHTLRRHTTEGMFSDPAYGGNRDLVGWKLIGYPGAQRAYSPELLITESEPRPPQALRDLPHFHPGVVEPGANPNVVQPVRDGEDDGEGP